jgi:outer membrane protein OmpA-like peptidoglycan-associated protein
MIRTTGRLTLAALLVAGTLGLSACANLSNTAKGGIIGAGAGAAVGAAVGNQVGSTATGAIVGAAVGGTAGALIGRQMDKQAEELESIEGATVTRVGEGIVVTFDTGILFGFDSSDLQSEARSNLQQLAANLNAHERTDVLIIGHTDGTGSESYNQALSERRARSAASYVQSQGVAAERVSIRGMGETDPVATNDTDEGRTLNRRVEVVIYADQEWRQEVQER